MSDGLERLKRLEKEKGDKFNPMMFYRANYKGELNPSMCVDFIRDWIDHTRGQLTIEEIYERWFPEDG